LPGAAKAIESPTDACLAYRERAVEVIDTAQLDDKADLDKRMQLSWNRCAGIR